MIDIDLQIPSPIQRIQMSLLDDHGIELYIKREDLIHPTVSGNKWRKLKKNIETILNEKYSGIITFGGAFSNHIYSTAAAAHLMGIQSVGIIRGEEDEQNPTLQFAKDKGMNLHFVSRSDYRQKEQSESIQLLLKDYPNYWLLPEGGSNQLGLEGCYEVGEELQRQFESPVDYLIVSAGTGCTAAGIIQSSQVKKKVLVNSVLKGDFLHDEIHQLLSGEHVDWELLTDYHFGGYGRTNADLIHFINTWKEAYGILLDPIYNGKSFYALIDLIKKGRFSRGNQLLYIHTGGLQGIRGWNYRNPELQIS